MKKLALVFLVLTLLVAAAILWFNRATRSPAGATLVPADTLVYAQIPNFPAARAQWNDSPVAAFLEDPAIAAFLEKPLAAARETLQGSRAAGNPDRWQPLLDLPQGEVFVAITQFAATPTPRVTGLLGVDCKLRKAQALAYLKLHEHQLAKYHSAATLEKKTYLGVNYTTVQVPPAPPVCHAFVGTLWVIANDENLLRDLISRHTGHTDSSEPSLANSPRYNTIVRQLPPTTASVFLNVEKIVGQFGVVLLMAAQTSPALQSLGNIQATVLSVNLSPTGLTDTTLITYTKQPPAAPAMTRATLRAAPADTAFYSVQATDLAGGYRALMELLAKSGNPTATKLGNDLDKFLTEAGLRLQDDFLAHLGPEVAYVGNWRPGAAAPDVALVATVNNRAAVDATFPRIVATIQKATGRADTLTHAGETLHVIRTDSSYLAPTFALTGNYFVLARSPDYAREIVSQLQTTGNSLADAADFKAVVSRVPAGGESFTYADLRKLLGGLYAAAQPNATNAEPAALIAWDKLPAPAAIIRHLGPYVSTTVAGDKTSTTITYSTLGKPLTFLVALAGGLAAAQPLIAHLPLESIPGLPTMSSGKAAPPPPPGNRTAPSQTPAP